METTDLLLMVGAMLAGAGLGSFGLNAFVRSRRGRSLLKRWRWWGLVLYYVAIAAIIVAWFGWIVQSLGEGTELEAVLEKPWFFFGFGFVVGLPFTLATVTLTWRDQRKPPSTGGKGKRKPATRQARLEFAKDLERQLKEYAGEARRIHTELQGEKGTILFLAGDISRDEGERLVAALRGEMQTLDFQRVEGRNENGTWWARV